MHICLFQDRYNIGKIFADISKELFEQVMKYNIKDKLLQEKCHVIENYTSISRTNLLNITIKSMKILFFCFNNKLNIYKIPLG